MNKEEGEEEGGKRSERKGKKGGAGNEALTNGAQLFGHWPMHCKFGSCTCLGFQLDPW